VEINKFREIIKILMEHSKKIDALCQLDINLVNYDDDLQKIIHMLFLEIYSAIGVEWIDWYLYEKFNGTTILVAFDSNGKEICQDIDGLFEIIQAEVL
jgi:hypothetical protein